jgi:hypothetical protein
VPITLISLITPSVFGIASFSLTVVGVANKCRGRSSNKEHEEQDFEIHRQGLSSQFS